MSGGALKRNSFSLVTHLGEHFGESAAGEGGGGGGALEN